MNNEVFEGETPKPTPDQIADVVNEALKATPEEGRPSLVGEVNNILADSEAGVVLVDAAAKSAQHERIGKKTGRTHDQVVEDWKTDKHLLDIRRERRRLILGVGGCAIRPIRPRKTI